MAGVFSNAISNGNVFADSVLVGAAGSAVSALTGGKFANGFVTAAFANIWNKCSQPNACTFGEAMKAASKGAFSSVKDIGTYFRMLGRHVGLYGSQSRLNAFEENRIFDELLRLYTFDPTTRSLINSYLDRNVFQRMRTDQEFRIYMEAKFGVGLRLGGLSKGMSGVMGLQRNIDGFIEDNRVALGWFVTTMNAYEKFRK